MALIWCRAKENAAREHADGYLGKEAALSYTGFFEGELAGKL
jgi:hypothetical protein